jgi:hypothetical protein
MTTDQKSYADLVRQTQDNVRWAVETWTGTMQDAFGALPTNFGPFDPYESVDKAFDFTKKVLNVQRDFTKTLIASATTENVAPVPAKAARTTKKAAR